MGGVTGAGSREAEEGHGGLCRQLGLAEGLQGGGHVFSLLLGSVGFVYHLLQQPASSGCQLV